ncbi:hypothetical protein [Flavobacterium frigidarium]|uniref:Uncharacterized protein n=1 Tax=Flavobacterium frigidarium TaxID=99286 RepID=A0ABV4KE62_9FLAO
MTFNEFIKELKREQVVIWWNTTAPNEAPEKAEEDYRTYMFSKDNKLITVEYALKNLEKYFNSDLSDFSNTVDPRNTFFEAYSFVGNHLMRCYL